MTRAQLLGAATLLVGLAAGSVVYFSGSSATTDLDSLTGGLGLLDLVDRSQCSVAVCNAPACTAAKNILQDAGSPCTVGFVDCSVRVGPVARAISADAGLVLSSALYQPLRLVGMRCPVDGGFTYGVPVDDAGWPLFALSLRVPGCVRAPLDGGTNCLRDLHDGDGGRWFGTGNVFSAANAAGSNCDQVECTVIYGDDPDQTL